MSEIARMEGFNKPMTLPRRMHNPGALKFARQRRAVLGDRGFARFVSDKDGWDALERDLRKKIREGRSLGDAWEYLE